jgi:hypothetical protein
MVIDYRRKNQTQEGIVAEVPLRYSWRRKIPSYTETFLL